MTINLFPGSHPSEPARNGAQGFGDWLTVAEAVVYCADKGLSRTPKTIRKWAHHSHRDPETADLTVRREDVDNGFRWTIKCTSLDLKIEQELEFEARRTRGSNEPVHTSLDPSEQVHTGASLEERDDIDQETQVGVRTSAHPSEPVRNRPNIVEQLESRIEDLKSEVEFYRDELRDRRQTTTALTDVIESFRLTAASNASLARDRAERRAHDIRSTHEGDKWQSDTPGGAL